MAANDEQEIWLEPSLMMNKQGILAKKHCDTWAQKPLFQ